MPGIRRASVFENLASIDIARDDGSIATLRADTEPVNVRPGCAGTVAVTTIPVRSAAAADSGTSNWSLIGAMRTTVTTLVLVLTYSPTATGRALTCPLNGATMTASATAFFAASTCATACATAASATATWVVNCS